MKILVKNNKERVKNQEVEMKKVQKLLRRSLATGLALVMTVSSMTIVPGSWQEKMWTGVIRRKMQKSSVK